MDLRNTILAVSGALLALGVLRQVVRHMRARINVAPVSEQWLAEQKRARDE